MERCEQIPLVSNDDDVSKDDLGIEVAHDFWKRVAVCLLLISVFLQLGLGVSIFGKSLFLLSSILFAKVLVALQSRKSYWLLLPCFLASFPQYQWAGKSIHNPEQPLAVLWVCTAIRPLYGHGSLRQIQSGF